MGPFPLRKEQLRFLIMAIDYFTKWVEAKPVTTITEAKVTSFVWKNIIYQFGILHVIISKILPRPRSQEPLLFSNTLQANGQTEVTNRSLLKIIKTRLEGARGAWLEEFFAHIG